MLNIIRGVTTLSYTGLSASVEAPSALVERGSERQGGLGHDGRI
jgi:hypothetical protein